MEDRPISSSQRLWTGRNVLDSLTDIEEHNAHTLVLGQHYRNVGIPLLLMFSLVVGGLVIGLER